MRRRVLLSAVGAAGAVLAGCGGGGDGSNRVLFNEMGVNPTRKSVAVGGTVTWRNDGIEEHVVVSRDYPQTTADWDVELRLSPGETTEHTFDAAGVYGFGCARHGETTECGVVLVGDVGIEERLPCEDPGAV